MLVCFVCGVIHLSIHELSAMDQLPDDTSMKEELNLLDFLEQDNAQQPEKLISLLAMIKYLPFYVHFYKNGILIGSTDIFKIILAYLICFETISMQSICTETPEKIWSSICVLQPFYDQKVLSEMLKQCLADHEKSLCDVKENGPRAQTILHWMCSNNLPASIIIAAAGDDIWGLLCAKDAYGDIPLCLAVVSGNLDFVTMLIQAADLCQKTGELIVMTASSGDQPQHLAVQGGHLEIAILFLNIAKQCGILSDFLMMRSLIEQRTALHAAAEYNRVEEMDELCQAAHDCGILKKFIFIPRSGNRTVLGNTALHQAVYSNHIDAVVTLLEWAVVGQCVDEFLALQNDDGCTASAIAKKMGHKEIVKILKNSKSTREKCCIQ